MDNAALETFEAAWRRHDKLDGSDKELVTILQICMKALTANVRHLLQLRYESDFSLRQVAEATGRSEGAVQVALSRTRMTLRHCVQKQTARK